MGKTFDDITGANAHENQPAIEALAARGIIDGMGDGLFHPEASMTRAQFAAIVVRALGLTPAASEAFTDVPPPAMVCPLCGDRQHLRPHQRRGRRPLQPGRHHYQTGGRRHGGPGRKTLRYGHGAGHRRRAGMCWPSSPTM